MWIGQGVFVKSGVRIGDGAVIAAHSVVIEDVPPYMIAAGVPAKVKKPRFPENIIERLMSIRWWDYNISSLEGVDFRDVLGAVVKLENAVECGDLKPYLPKKIK